MNQFLSPDTLSWGDVLIRLAAAALLPLAIGLERFARSKPIDFRPYVTISIVACALMISTADLSSSVLDGDAAVDPTRVMQGVITGIGFLGAGAMYREGDYVKGAGSAASIWSAGAIGLICGIGELWLGGAITVAILCLMIAGEPVTSKWHNDDTD